MTGFVRPVAIFEHEPHIQPGRFRAWLQAQGFPFALIRIHAGDAVPAEPRKYSGLCFMGGTMSVNDDLPWIAEELELIRLADAAGIPVIGHCLGGQLIAKALGAAVSRARFKEVGWTSVRATDARLARQWLGEAVEAIEVFQWHGETFELPAGAQCFLANDFCARQAYVIERDGFAHLGMQFHIEMTPELVRDWSGRASNQAEIELDLQRQPEGGIQRALEQQADLEARAARLAACADALYSRWARGLSRA